MTAKTGSTASGWHADPKVTCPTRTAGWGSVWRRSALLVAVLYLLIASLARLELGVRDGGLAAAAAAAGVREEALAGFSPELFCEKEGRSKPSSLYNNMRHATSRWASWLSYFLFAASAAPSGASPMLPPSNTLRACEGEKGAVASESIECSEIGRDLLSRGGNAVDALVGTTFCVGVIGMYHSGIGGGGFLLVRDSEGNYESIDFRETAPAAAFEDMYKNDIRLSIIGGLAAGIPGEVRGLEYAHMKYGALPWKDVMQGAIKLARYGFKVSDDLVKYMAASISGQTNFLVDDPVWAVDFAPNGTLVKVGDIITRKRYANTLEKIANQGGKAFYEGEIAEEMISLIQSTNGTMTLNDLATYNITAKPPLTASFRGYNLFAVGAPASGAVSLSTLKTMEQYPASDFAADVPLAIHRFTEAMRFAYGARQQLGDPAFLADISTLETLMLDEGMAKAIRERILDNATQPVKNYDPEMVYSAESHGTSHVVTADSSGMATSLTTTINLLFGAQIMTEKSGIILNNEMNDFSVPGVPNQFGYQPSPANYIRPGKRPLSSCTPIIAEFTNGTLYATVGAAGGSRIISSTTQVTWLVLDQNYTMPLALAEPRVHDQLMPNVAAFEKSFNNDTIASMVSRGHNVTFMPHLSSVQGIRVLPAGTFEPASEPRQANSGGLVAR